jgi:hypothetical protein
MSFKGDFLNLIESYKADASASTILREDGMRRPGGTSPSYMQSLKETIDLISGVAKGKIPAYRLQEAMTTSDFPILMGDVMDRALVSRYAELPAVYRQFCDVKTVNDFRAMKLIGLDGGEAPLSEVKQSGEYGQRNLSESEKSIQVKKYGAKIGLSWESIINDNLDAFTDLPDRLARAARRTESRLASGLYVGTNGYNTALFTSGNKNLISGNPTLTIDGLTKGLQALSAQKDSDGEPIYLEAAILVVPPALEYTARAILNATELEITTETGKVAKTGNYLKNKVSLVVDPYIPIIATTNGATSWFLFADPQSTRAAIRMGFLRGHESPEMFVRMADSQRVSGGGTDQVSFDTDEKEYKVRHVVGGAQQDPKMAVASSGAGS